MDQESQQRFDQLAAIEPAAWTEADKAFMTARSSYMTEDQRIKFAAVLSDAPPGTDQTEPADEASDATGTGSAPGRKRK